MTSVKTIIYPVKDLAATKALFSSLLGAEPHTDQPYYVGFTAGEQEIGLDPNGHSKGLTGPVAYWHVEDIQARLAALVAAGGKVQQDVQDVGGGRQIASVTDPDGNAIGILQDS